MTGALIREEIRTQKQRQRDGYTQARREASEEINCTYTLILDFNLYNYEKINFYCVSHPVCGICYGSPSKLIYL